MINNKGQIQPFVWVITILAGLLVILPALGFDLGVGSFFGSNDFVKPSWARLECAPTDGYEGTTEKWLDQQTLFKCSGFTEECEVVLRNTGAIPSHGTYRNCDLSGNSCGGNIGYTTNSVKTLPKLNAGRSYKFAPSFGTAGVTKIEMQWKPWKLYRFVGGAKFVVNSQNCQLTNNVKDQVRERDFVFELGFQGGEGQKWVNYVDDWNYGPGTNVVSHPQHGEVYCSAGQVREIVKLRMADGSLVKLDPEYNGRTNPKDGNGETINGLGNLLENVECCPNEPGCTDNFQFEGGPDDPGGNQDECFSDLQCFNAGGPVPQDSFHYVTYECLQGSCQESSPIQVECTTNSACADGEICDLSTTNYGVCITQSTGPYCGNGVCDAGEGFTDCPIDCALECPPGQTLVTETSSEGALCFFGVGLCSDNKVQYCDDKKGFNFTPFLWVLVAVGVIFLFRRQIAMLWKATLGRFI